MDASTISAWGQKLVDIGSTVGTKIVLALLIFEKCRGNKTWWGWALGLAGIAGCALVSVLLKTDYSYYAVILVAVYYIFRGAGRICSNGAGLLFQVLDHPHDVQTWSILSFVPLMLYNGEKVFIYQRREKALVRKKATKQAEPRSDLFDYLRTVRLELAKQEKVPAYIILSNAALSDMAMKLPHTRQELLNVSGIGEVKAQRYGDVFLQAIQSWENNEHKS